MADIKSAQQVLKDVPRNDALKALQEITEWVESVRDNADFQLDQRFDVLSLLDESARTYMRKLVREYFSAPAQSQFQENRTWMVLNEFFTQIEQAYFKVLTGYHNGEKGSSAIKSAMPLVTARGIYAVMGRLKYASARYLQVDETIWKHLAEYYSHAEAHQFLNEPVTLYAGLTPATTVKYKFASLVMWYAPGSGSLSPLHMHLAERLANHFGSHFTVDTQLASGSQYSFDLAHPAQLGRVTADTTPLSSMRFLGAGDIGLQIDALVKMLEKNIVPEEISLGGVYPAAIVCDVVRHLAIFWTSPPPMRRNTRRQINVNMNVVHGFSSVVKRGETVKHGDLQHDETGSATDRQPSIPRDAAVGTNWEVEDISIGGFRGVLPGKSAGGVKIGSLVGIKPENVEFLGVGIVRRMTRDGQNNLHAGVEILSKQVENVVLHMHGDSRADGEQTALWLRGPGDDTGEVWLLMNPDAFSMNLSLNTLFEGKSYLLIPLALLERGGDYDLARYRKVEEEPDSASDAY